MPQNYSKVYSKSFSSKVKRMKARMEAVRLHRALHQEKRKQVSLTRSRGLVMQRMATSAPSTPKVAPKIQSLFDDVNNMHRNLTSNEQTRQEILANMLWNLFVEPKQRRYTAKMIRFAILIAGLSVTCYSVLRRFLVLPDYSTVFRHASHDVDSNLQCLTDIYRFKMHTPRIFEKVQEQCRDCVRYGGFLAVDAISLQPHIYVTKEGFIEGVLDNDANLSSDELSVLKASYIKYEEFVKTIKNWRTEIINSFERPYENRKQSNALCESFNQKLRILINVSYGFANFDRFRARALYCLNDAVFYSITSNLKRTNKREGRKRGPYKKVRPLLVKEPDPYEFDGPEDSEKVSDA